MRNILFLSWFIFSCEEIYSKQRNVLHDTGFASIGGMTASEPLQIVLNTIGSVIVRLQSISSSTVPMGMYMAPMWRSNATAVIGLRIFLNNHDISNTANALTSISIANQGKGTGSITTNYGLYLYDQTAGNTKYSIYSEGGTMFHGGSIGIGCLPGSSEKLVVNGNIKAKKLIVSQTGWSDYVFANEYRLRILSSLESYIKDNKHLPEVPSAIEVAEKGISVGENQALLLKKIEELTLYVIELQKQVNELKRYKKQTSLID